LRTLLFLYCLALTTVLAAQVEPPDLLCTRSEAGEEILRWDNTSTACGAYQGTQIFSGTDIGGPFTLVVELTDASAIEFRDPNPTGELRYYFIRYRYDCPGLAVVNSDTLDNRIPATPVLQYAGVEGNDIVIDWLPSVSPEVDNYVILEVTASTIIPRGTVIAPNTVFRLPIQAGDLPTDERRFRLVAFDACGNDSSQGAILKPMSLSLTGGMGCDANVQLLVDQAAISSYLPATLLELFVSVDGGAFASAGTAPPNADMVTYRDANDGEDLCFYVEAVLANGFGRARSVEVCQTVSLNQPVRDFPLYGAGFTPTGELTITYAEPTNPPALASSVLRLNRGNEITPFPLTGSFFNGTGIFLTPFGDAELSGNEAISVRLTDDCDREVTTNEVIPVELNGQALFSGQNLLRWTPFSNGLDGDLTYAVFRAIVPDVGAAAGATYVSIATGLTDLSFNDDVSTLNGGIACYRVEANFQPTGGLDVFAFSSRIVCVESPTEVYLPTAFSPASREATNQVFRPYFSSLPPAEGYQLLVFDRWGGLLFETSDPATGWAGDSKGQVLSSGTYLYRLQFQANDGQLQQRTGTVNLLR